ncbi:WAT1-related protein At1g68170-like [Impatiens glandulifera]|uniref:WAT1-related protein At1g68170-like n=1 Tax=Impatiens glandulifera TaxID=253017 RepID=UPI001FB0D374|nr:WAT1-related protein At1g68170-like [Impatiens glandulifera]
MMMVVVQMALAGVNVFYKLSAANGMSLRVLIAYRFIIAALVLVPLSLILERNKRPKLTWITICQTFFCGMLGGSLAQNLYAQSLLLTSATFAAAMVNLVPALTFILALIFRMELMRLNKASGRAKVVGTLTCVGGAMLLTFYKGREVVLWSTNVNLLEMFSPPGSYNSVHSGSLSGNNRVFGALLALGCCCTCALGYILQAKLLRNYPCPYSSTALMMLFGALQASVYAIAMERDWSVWKLGWNLRLISVLYSGIVASGMTFTLMAWCVQMRGPLFVSVFNPLMLVLVAVVGSLFLEEQLHVGSIIGAVVIVLGLYIVLWGKGQEMKRQTEPAPLKRSKESNNAEEQLEVVVFDHDLSTTSNEDDEVNNDDMNNHTMLGLGVVLCSPALVELCDDGDSRDDDEYLSVKSTIGVGV